MHQIIVQCVVSSVPKAVTVHEQFRKWLHFETMRHFARWCLAARKPNDITGRHHDLDDIFADQRYVEFFDEETEAGQSREKYQTGVDNQLQSRCLTYAFLGVDEPKSLPLPFTSAGPTNGLTGKHSHCKSDNDARNSQ